MSLHEPQRSMHGIEINQSQMQDNPECASTVQTFAFIDMKPDSSPVPSNNQIVMWDFH